MSAGFHIPVPVDVGLFLKQKAGTPLSEVKRPPNVWVIFRSCAVHNWPKALGPKPKNVMKVSRLLQPVWEALQNSRRFQAWQLFSLRVTNAHNMRFPNYKFNPAKKGTKVSRKPKKLKDRKASLRGSGSKANEKLSSHEKISTETSQLFSFPPQPETPSAIPSLLEDGALGDRCIVGYQPWQHWKQGESSQDAKSEQYHNYGGDFAEDESSLVTLLRATSREALDTRPDTENISFDVQGEPMNYGDELYHNATDGLFETTAYVYHGTMPSSPNVYGPRLYLPDEREETPFSLYENYINQKLDLPSLNLE